MHRSLLLSIASATLLVPSVASAAPVIGSVTPITATAGVSVNLSASVSSAVPIASCTLWVDLAEIGTMTVNGETASRAYIFPSGGSRIAFVFCKDTNNGMSAGATTAITVSGAVQVSPPLQTSPAPTTSSPTPPISSPAPVPAATVATSSPSVPTSQTPTSSQSPSPNAGRLLKERCPEAADMNHSCRAVYYVGKDGNRHAFPNSRIFFTWYGGFESVEEVALTTLSTFPLGTNVQYRAGVRMVKFTTDPKVYAVSRGGLLRWIKTETLARAYYGNTWNTRVDDIPDSFYDNYTFGDDLTAVADYNPETERAHSTE